MECDTGQYLSATARDHARTPRRNGALEAFNGHARITGPCGDTMEVWVLVRGGTVERASFITDGCDPSYASGSMAVFLAEGGRVEEVAAITQRDIIDALGGLPEDVEHCALLAALTLRAACDDSRDRSKGAVGGEARGGKDARGPDAGSPSPGTQRLKGESDEEFEARRMLQERLGRIGHKIVVLSGKGGVGKSTVAVNIAVALAMSGTRVGLLDIDIHGPSIPTMLGLEGARLEPGESGLLPVDVEGLKVMSIGFLLRSQDDAVIWRGPMKMGVIKQFLGDVEWGDLDYLVIDSPPGTGDEPLSVIQLLGKVDGAVIVTTPQKVAAVDVRKSISFCRQLGVPVLGVVENMSGFACPGCGEVTYILHPGGGRRISEDMNVPFLGSIPMDPQVAESSDSGRAFIQHYGASATAGIMRGIIAAIEASVTGKAPAAVERADPAAADARTRIAIPVAEGRLAAHFGHSERFALVDVDCAAKKILGREDVEAPPHEPGLLPTWLAERRVRIIIAGGMGRRAQDLFTAQNIEVVIGAPAESPERLVADYLAGTLKSGENVCDH